MSKFTYDKISGRNKVLSLIFVAVISVATIAVSAGLIVPLVTSADSHMENIPSNNQTTEDSKSGDNSKDKDNSNGMISIERPDTIDWENAILIPADKISDFDIDDPKLGKGFIWRFELPFEYGTLDVTIYTQEVRNILDFATDDKYWILCDTPITEIRLVNSDIPYIIYL